MKTVECDFNVHQSLDAIEKNLVHQISLDDLARNAYLSKYHYHRLFHKLVGESVNQYIVRRRMERAAHELIETSEPIIDIALKYQYGSQESFIRAFKRVHHMTPGKYRRVHTTSKRGTVIRLHSRGNRMGSLAA